MKLVKFTTSNKVLVWINPDHVIAVMPGVSYPATQQHHTQVLVNQATNTFTVQGRSDVVAALLDPTTSSPDIDPEV